MTNLTCESLATKVELEELSDKLDELRTDINRLLGAKELDSIDIKADDYDEAVKRLINTVPGASNQNILSSAWDEIKNINEEEFSYNVLSSGYEEVLGQTKFPEGTVMFNTIELARKAIQGVEEIEDDEPDLIDSVLDWISEGVQTKGKRAKGQRRLRFLSGKKTNSIDILKKRSSINLSKMAKSQAKTAISLSKTATAQAKIGKLNFGLIQTFVDVGLHTVTMKVVDQRLDAAERQFYSIDQSYSQIASVVDRNNKEYRKVTSDLKKGQKEANQQIAKNKRYTRDLEAELIKVKRTQEKILDRIPEIDEIKSDLADLRQDFDEFETETDEALNTLKQQLESLEAETESLSQKQTDLIKQVTDLEKEISLLKQRVDSLESQLKTLRKTIEKNYEEYLNFKDLTEHRVDRLERYVQALDVALPDQNTFNRFYSWFNQIGIVDEIFQRRLNYLSNANRQRQQETDSLEQEKVDEKNLRKILREEIIEEEECGLKKTKEDLINTMPVFPDMWHNKKQQLRDQLIITYNDIDINRKSGNYSLIIPHYNGDKSPNITSYRKGNFWGRLILTDNSTILVNCLNKKEAIKIINQLKKYVKDSYLTDNISYGEYSTNRLKEITVKPIKADYYKPKTSELNQTAEWRIYFDN